MKLRAFVVVPESTKKGTCVNCRISELTLCGSCKWRGKHTGKCLKEKCPCYGRRVEGGFFCEMGEREEGDKT